MRLSPDAKHNTSRITMTILAIETSGKGGSVALADGQRVIEMRSLSATGRRHARTLVPELRAHLLHFTPKAHAPAPATHLVHGTAIPVTQEAIVAFAERHGISVFEAVRRWEEIAAAQHQGVS